MCRCFLHKTIYQTQMKIRHIVKTTYFSTNLSVFLRVRRTSPEVTLRKYLGSKIEKDGQLDAEINCRIMKASASFGKLHSRVWSSHDLKLNTKVEVYNIVVLSTLLRRGLFTTDTSRSSRPSTNDACVPYVASNGKTWSQILKYFRDAKPSRLKPTSAIVN